MAELERSRDELMVRVGEATLREKGAGERLSALEEKMAEATAAAADSGCDTCRGGSGARGDLWTGG